MAERQIGLALGSGGARGHAVFPIIQRLEREGIVISVLSGSSVGAIIAAYYALHGEVDSLFASLKKLSRRDHLKLIDPNHPKKSLIRGEKIKKFMADNFFGQATFQDAKRPLFVSIVDVEERKTVHLQQGKLVDAVMASISIPGIVPPYRIRKKYYVDGGVLTPVPIQPLLDLNLKKVIGINLMGCLLGPVKPSLDLVPSLLATFYMMMEKLSLHPGNDRLFMLNLAFKPDPTTSLLFYRWREYYEVGTKYINQNIGELINWLYG